MGENGSRKLEEKGKRLWKKVGIQLVDYQSLPGYLRDNEYIKGHYRPRLTIKQAFFSIFSIHNETLNVWTHLIGFFIFFWLTIYTTNKVPKVVDLHSLQRLPDLLKKADIPTCLHSLPNMSNIYQELKTSIDTLPSGWHNKRSFVLLLWLGASLSARSRVEHVSTYLHDRFFSVNHNQDASCLSHSTKEELANVIAPLVKRPITRWPFFAFLGAVMFCFLASSACHMLSCHSERLSYIMLRLDYVGIAALISTSFYPPVYYSFMCYPFFCNLYMGFITLLGIATMLFSLIPTFQKPDFRIIRVSFFAGMGLSGVLPVFHKQVMFWNQPEALLTTGYEILMGMFYLLGALIYATRVPERWVPRKFDIAGSSHQLFHVLVVAGAYTHYRSGLIYLQWRDSEGC